jgi:hypothetical protein
MKTNKIFTSIGLSLLLLGCNSNNSISNTVETQKVSVPNTIDMKLPKALESSSKTQKYLEKTDKTLANKSRGYTQLKDEVAGAEAERKVVQINLLLAEKIMPQIQEACEDTPLVQTCEIEDGELSFVLDVQMRNDIANILGESFPSNTPDKKMTLGKTTFTQHADSEDYQYTLSMDMSAMIRRVETDKTIYTQIIKWSKDESRVWSIYGQENEESTSNISLRYFKDENGQTQMEIDEEFKSLGDSHVASTSTVTISDSMISVENDTPSVEKVEEEFHFKITNKDDYFKIISNSHYVENDKKIESSSSVGEVSDDGGYLNFRGIFLANEYREKEKFNANGNVIFSGYCDSSQECDLNDESTWLEHGDNTFEPAIEVEFVELSINGGNLKEGMYLLLASNTDISKLSVEEVFDATIGNIYVSNNFTYGSLHTKKYLTQLDTLLLVHVILDIESVKKDPLKEGSFELVNAENRPVLREK